MKHREIRQLAFQTLFQLDVRGEEDVESIHESILADDLLKLSDEEKADAFALGLSAFRARVQADTAMRKLAPTWPAHRQPAVDRAILRLAHHEMATGKSEPKVAVNEAIELAKKFSTDRSPAFVNGLLDKILKETLANARSIDSEPTTEREGSL